MPVRLAGLVRAGCARLALGVVYALALVTAACGTQLSAACLMARCERARVCACRRGAAASCEACFSYFFCDRWSRPVFKGEVFHGVCLQKKMKEEKTIRRSIRGTVTNKAKVDRVVRENHMVRA